MSDDNRYVDPNSGAAQQPGGFAVSPAVTEEDPAPRTLGDPEADPILAHTRETQASPAGEQPADGSQSNSAEDGTTTSKEGEGNDNTDGAETGSTGESEGDGEQQQSEGDSTEEPESTESEDDTESDDNVELYSDLLSGSVKEIKQYLEEHPEERDAVVEAEKQGQNRKGIVEG